MIDPTRIPDMEEYAESMPNRIYPAVAPISIEV